MIQCMFSIVVCCFWYSRPTGICESEMRSKFSESLDWSGILQVKKAHRKHPNSPINTTITSKTNDTLRVNIYQYHKHFFNIKTEMKKKIVLFNQSD